jgi:membrane associated rhomboid family serine protease
MFIFLIIWLACGVWGYLVGDKKNKGTLGLLLGIVFGIFGVLAIYLIKGDKITARLRDQVNQAELRTRLAKLEQEQYDIIMRANEPHPEYQGPSTLSAPSI